MSVVPDIRIHSDIQATAEAAAAFVLEVGEAAVRSISRFCIALSGGTTPEALYKTLTAPAVVNRLDWSKTIFFFSDERCVPPDDPRSNYALAAKTLFTPLKIPPSQVYRMAGESSDPQAAASEYERQLRLATKTSPSAQPSLDLVLLGLGEDGHTASLFPGASILRDHQRTIAATKSPKDPPDRLTMTLAAINRASVILFLVTGAGKARVVRSVLHPQTEADQQLPASLVRPREGRVIWFIDRSAAAELPMHLQRTSA